MMNKKIIIGLGAVILLLIIAGVILLASGSGEEQKEPAQASLEVKKLTDDQVISPILSFDGAKVWYFTPQGRVFWIKGDGTGLSEFTIPALENSLKSVLWPKNSSDFIALTSSIEGELKYYYDSDEKKYVELPANIQSIDWMPDDQRVVYIWKSGDNVHQQLVLANPDASGFKVLKEVFWPDLEVRVSPSGNEALLVRSKMEGDVNKIYRANLQTGDFETVIEEGKNLDLRWLSSEKFVFARTAAGLYPKLLVYSFDSRLQTDLNLATSLDKIVFDSDGKLLYAAVPKADNTGDRLIKVDLTTLKQDVIYDPEQDIRMKDMLLSSSTLYFVNSRDNKLYSINLPF